MKCFILSCLSALLLVQTQRKKCNVIVDIDKDNHKLVKRKVFTAACAMMMDFNSDNNGVVVKTILTSFPDEKKREKDV